MYIFISIMTSLSQGVVGVLVTGLALLCMGMALIRMSSGWMVAAALLTVPYTYTTGSWSGILLAVRLLPLTQLLAAFAIEKEEKMLAWVLSIPTFLMLGYSFYDITINQAGFQTLDSLVK